MSLRVKDIAGMIDHSLLHPTMTDTYMRQECERARRLDVASVCIKPYAVPMAAAILEDSPVAVGTVVGFPHGGHRLSVKVKETECALDDGAVELDVVVNVGKALSEDWTYISEEVKTLNDLCVAHGALLKVILENDFLGQDAFKVKLCEICNTHAVAFVKTSTGYGYVKQEGGLYDYKGATDHDLALMRRTCQPSVQVKAAGKVRTLDDVLRVKALGVTRVGATATEAILEEAARRGFG